MDLIKIGRYIADKRKTLGLTQKQVAERLGMSDKSVSKWERGMCLPDVSVYFDLCDILGISINEFLAGEDLSGEEVVKKSEDNLIQTATDSKYRQKRLKRIIAALAAVTMLAIVVVAFTLLRNNRPQNVIVPLEEDSVEMRMAELLSGVDGAFLFRYTADDGYNSMTIYFSKYQSGKLIDRQRLETVCNGLKSPDNGMIAIIPDFSTFTVKLIITDETSKISTSFPILDGVENRAYYGRSAKQLEGEVKIRFGEEQGLVAIICDNDYMRVTDMQEIENGIIPPENDFMLYFSVQFSK